MRDLSGPLANLTGHFVEANGIRQHYLEFGTGDRALLLLHGITGGAGVWRDQAPAFAEMFRVIVPDLRGHGVSDHPEWGYSLVDYTRDQTGLIAALGLVRPAVVGHSLGGRIALSLAAQQPAAIGRAVAVDPPVSGPGRPRYPYPLDRLQAIRQAVEAEGIAGFQALFPYPLAPEQAAIRAHYSRLAAPNAVQESWFGFHLEDIFPLVTQLRVPSLFVYGDHGVVRSADAAELAQLNPTLPIVEIPNAGHGVPWDNWPVFWAAVSGFLAEDTASA